MLRAFGIDQYLALSSPKILCATAYVAPVIDGQINDSVWDRKPDIPQFVTMDITTKPVFQTSAWLGADRTALYIAIKCIEPDQDSIIQAVDEHDGTVWLDDSIEIFIDANLDRETFYQIIINTAGVTFDAADNNASWDGPYEFFVDMNPGEWNIEIAIPWKSIGLFGQTDEGSQIGFNLQRSRSRDGLPYKARHMQWAPTNLGSQRPELFGRLEF